MKKLNLLCLFLFLVSTLFATHNRGGEILYKRVAPYTTTVSGIVSNVYNYSITVILYTDGGINVANRCVDTLYFGDGTKSVLLRSNGNGTCSCQISSVASASCGEIVLNQPGYIVKKSIYSTIHTYAGPGQYVIKTTDVNRNENILNLPNSINTPLYIESFLVINSTSNINSSPVCNNPPYAIATNVNCFYHLPGAIDADGDSLSYELIPCKGQNGSAIVGYTYPSTNPNGYFFLDHLSGLISWCRPNALGEYAVAYYVKEWRKNTNGIYELIGMVQRDMQIIVLAGVLSVNQIQSTDELISTFPTPFDEKLNIEVKNEGNLIHQLKLYNMAWQLIYEAELKTNKASINTESLPPGLYFIEVTNQNQRTFKKLLKQ